VVFPEPPFSFPTTMTCGKLRDFTAAFSMAAPRKNQLHEGNCRYRNARRTTLWAKLRGRQLIERTSWGGICSGALNSNNAVRSPTLVTNVRSRELFAWP